MELDLLNLLMVLTSAWLAGRISNRLGYPAVLGELLVGIVLGPPLLGMLHGAPALAMLAELGVLLMMLYIGMEVDPRELRKASWPGLPAALIGFVAPFALAVFAVMWFGGEPMAGVFLGIAAGMTSLATGSRILAEMEMLDTRIAHVMMTAALVADTLALLIFAGIVSMGGGGSVELMALAWVGLKVVAFFVMVVLVGTRVLPLIWDRLTVAGLTDRTSHFMLVLLIAVLFGELAEIAGLHAILGAFVAGMFLRENVLGRQLSHELMGVVREASLGFMAPIFFVTAGFHVTFAGFTDNLGLFAVLLAVVLFGKIGSVALAYALTGHSWREGAVTGAGMNGRGAVEIIIAGLGLEMGLLSQELFSILVIISICTTSLVPVMLKGGVDWLGSRGELVRASVDRLGTVIIGAGATARALARALKAERPVWLVDADPGLCEVARAEGLPAICGDALREAVLCRANTGQAAALVAMTANNEVNVLVARLARTVFHVPAIHVLNTGRNGRGLTSALRHLSAKTLFGEQVPVEQWDAWLQAEEVDAREISSAGEFEVVMDTDEEPTEDDSSLILAIRRRGEIEPYDGSGIEDNEEVILLTRRNGGGG